MAHFRSLPDHEVDALLRGEQPEAADAPLADLITVLRSDVAQHGAPPMSDALRAQLVAPLAAVPSPLTWARPRRKVLLAGLGGVVLGASALGVAAAQGSLPAAIQDATASVVSVVGVDLPRSDEPADHGAGDRRSDGDADGSHPSGPSTGGSEGPPDTTAGGTVPADPGTPGDHEPAAPATPTTGNGQGTDHASGSDARNAGGGGANGTSPGRTDGATNGTADDHPTTTTPSTTSRG
jgi:hypothetical protein